MNSKLKSHFFWKHTFGADRIFHEPTKETDNKLDSLIRYTYLFFLFLTVIRFNNIEDIEFTKIVDPLWPVFWVNNVGFRAALNWNMLLLFIALLLTVVYYKQRSLRIISFVLFFIYTALINSFGKISHIYHLLLVVLFFFMFLSYKNEQRLKNRLLVATVQFFILLTYTITGVWKVIGGVYQYSLGEVSIFSFQAMEHIINYQFEINNQVFPYFTQLLLKVPWLASILLLISVIVECIAISTFFKPKWQLIWAVCMISIHGGIALLLDVNFYVAPFVLGIFFVLSPFIKEKC